MSYRLAKFGYFGIAKVFVGSLLSLLVCILVANSVSAASYLNVSSSSGGTISFGKVKPSAAGVSANASDTLTINTNCNTGYSVYVSGQNGKGTSLVNTDSNIVSNNTIATSSAAIGSATVLSNNTWGISADSTSTTTGAYVGLPTYANALNTPLTTKSNVAEQTTVPIYYGAKVSTAIAPGTYTGDILYTVLPDHNCSEYTLKFNTNDATASTLTDQTYTVNALVDLATYSSNSAISRTGYTLSGWKDQDGNSYSTTDVVDVNPSDLSEVTLTAQWEINRYNVAVQGGFISSGYTSANHVKYSHTANISDNGERSGDYTNNLATKEVISFADIPEATKIRAIITYGTEPCCDYVYVFNGTYTGSVTSNMSAGQLATYKGESSAPVTVALDIPGNIATFAFYSDGSVTSYGYYAILVPLDANGNVLGGGFEYGSTIGITATPNAGYHLASWSSSGGGSFGNATASSTTFTIPAADTTLSYTTAVNTYTIAYNGSSPTSGSVSSQTGLSYTGSVTLRANGYGKSGYNFLGWSRSSGSSSATYSASTSYSVSSIVNAAGVANKNGSTITLYAAWQIVTFQTADSCAKIAVNTSGSLKDSRDNQTYGVYRWPSSGTAGTDYPTNLAGYCIMTKDLSLGYVTGGSVTKGTNLTLTTDTSAGSGTIIYRAKNTDMSSTNSDSNLQYINGPKSELETYSSLSYYSYGAGLKVCPKGWHPPTKTEFDSIAAYMGGNNATAVAKITNSTFKGVYTGYVGPVSGGNFSGTGTYGHWWGSTQSSSTKGYYLYFGASTLTVKSDGNKRGGQAVRCIAESPIEDCSDTVHPTNAAPCTMAGKSWIYGNDGNALAWGDAFSGATGANNHNGTVKSGICPTGYSAPKITDFDALVQAYGGTSCMLTREGYCESSRALYRRLGLSGERLFWSSTEYASYASYILSVDFTDGYTSNAFSKTDTAYMLCYK